MHRILFILTLTIALFATLIGFSALNGTICFGTGLGDVVYIMITFALSIALICLLFIYRKSSSSNKVALLVIFIVSLIFSTYLLYSFTAGRGAESSWDGNIFCG